MSAHQTPEQIRKNLKHPIIDGDGHWVEYTPVFAEQIRKVWATSAAPQQVPAIAAPHPGLAVDDP